ncbi:late control protein [Desulfovibrio sp. OttesenSCG-928-G11]|nr:late control protein [Desulfovibrio sp. OttesenSCG-928-G11]
MRRATLEITYQGKNISKDIAPDLLSFAFREKADGEADELELNLADPDRLWQDDWAPEKGDSLRALIRCENWFEPGDAYELDCGGFEVDEDELSSTSGGDTVSIKAVPAVVKSSLAGQKKSRAWEGASLERIAKDISKGAGLSLVYEAEGIALQRIDQRQETDLAFLQRLCSEQGCRLKIADKEMIVFAGVRADALEPASITRQKGDNFRAKRVTAEVYSGVKVAYMDPTTGKKYEYSYKDASAPATGKTLTINKRCENPAQAQRIGLAELRKKNAKKYEAEWSGMGNPLLRAGATVKIEGWGQYDGTYAIKEAGHEMSDGGKYTSSVKLESAQDF